MTTAYLSSYANLTVTARVLPNTQDSLTVNARAVLGEAETLTQAVWETDDQGVAGLVSASIDDQASACIVSTTVGGYANVRCQLTTSTGRKLPQMFTVESDCNPFTDGISFGSQTLSVINP